MRRTALLAMAAIAILGTARAAGPLPDGVAGFRTGVAHPADVVRFAGKYVATEILSNRLAIFDDLALRNLRYLDPAAIGRHLQGPHYLAVTPWGTLLVSDGWGVGIVEIRDLAGGGWRHFSGIGQRMDAPHGVCVSDDGWIYVGDSLNSRLVRFRDMDGGGWEVFADHDRRVAYSRQLVCDGKRVWIANSYEKRPGLNPGTGGNVLRVDDFGSGRAVVAASVPDASITALALVDGGRLLLGLWDARPGLALAGRDGVVRRLAPPPAEWGVPYGIHRDPASGHWMVAFFGWPPEHPTPSPGGIALLTVPPEAR